MAVLEFMARNGRMMLVAGLVAGIALPGLAVILRPWIAPMIVALLFLAVLRLGPDGLVAGFKGIHRAIGLALFFQLVLPLFAAGIFAIAGVLTHPLAMGVVLVLAAAPITGSPNITAMTGGDPAPSLRQLVLGTAILPLTVFPVFLVMPAFGDAGDVARAAAWLLLLITLAGGLAIALRLSGVIKGTPRAILAMDGVAALLLGLVVIGMMSAIGPAFTGNPLGLAAALVVVFSLNMGLQLAASAIAAKRNPAAAPAIGIAAGNRNAALFLSVLPAQTADLLLLFIGCFQIPMYLTPFVLDRWYGRLARRA
jgi:arsenite transporter